MNKPCLLILRYLIGKYGAEFLARYIIKNYLPTKHLSANPRKRISDEVMEDRIER